MATRPLKLLHSAAWQLGRPLERLPELPESIAELGWKAPLTVADAIVETAIDQSVDLVVLVDDDADAEALIFDLRDQGYRPLATVEHQRHGRLATARLASPSGIVVDLMFANCGIEREVVERATTVAFATVPELPVAASEELVAMKILSMTDARLQDRLDAQRLIAHGTVDLHRVRDNLRLIAEREFDRGQDLTAKLELVVNAISGRS